MSEPSATSWCVLLAVRRVDADGSVHQRQLGAVRLRFGPDDRVGDAIVAAGGFAEPGALPAHPHWAGLVLADGTLAEADDLLSGLPVSRGDRLTIVAVDDASSSAVAALRAAPTPSPTWELVAVDAGPPPPTGPGGAAPLALLSAGRSTVGRGGDADVRLDDPAVSRLHARLEVADVVTVVDLGSTNGTDVDGRPVDGPTPVRAGEQVRFGDTRLELRRRRAGGAGGRTAATGRRWVDPVGLVMPAPAPATVVVPDPPVNVDRPRVPWISTLVPLLAIGGLLGAMSRVGGGHTDRTWLAVSAGFLLLGPLISMASWAEARWSARREARTRRRTALAQLALAVDRGAALRAVELARRRALRPAPLELAGRAARPADGLWSGGAVFDGTVRIGVWEGPTLLRFETASGTPWCRVERSSRDAKVVAAVDTEVAALAVHPSVPFCVPGWTAPAPGDDGANVGEVIGVVGHRATVVGVVEAALLGLTTLLGPDQLGVELVVGGSDRSSDWDALTWVPHVSVGEPAAGRGDGGGLAERPSRRLVLVDHEATGADVSAAAVAAARAGGDAVIWVGADRGRLPAGASTLVEVHERVVGAPDGTVVDLRTGEEAAVRLDHVDPAGAEDWAVALAPWVARPGAAGSAEPPARVPLSAVVGVVDDAPMLRSRWARATPPPVATIGMSGAGPLTVDLRRDGPHVLVAGTTGAGKSELLQTFVAALAAGHPPDQVSFLLVDYKGGAAFGECGRLPHVVGLVTDLDDALAERALVSLRAELRRREELLAVHGVKDLSELERADPDAAPPSLVVVVDEFAALVAEVPTFVDGVVDLARRGRSLGLHLVLATQRPSGVVSDQVLANANLRIALRVTDPHDSVDLVGSADAAAIRRDRPGRAVVRFGAGERTLVQIAHGAAPPVVVEGGVRIEPFVLGSPGSAGAVAADAAIVEGRSELARFVDSAVEAADGWALPRRPWLDPLPGVVRFGDLSPAGTPPDHVPPRTRWPAVVGWSDDPARSAQFETVHDLAAGPTVVHARGAMAATIVESVVAAALRGRSPSAVRVDVVDAEVPRFAHLSGLPHVGSVIAADDIERIGRLLTSSREELTGGASTVPVRLVVFADVVTLVERLERVDPDLVGVLARVASDGASGGVHVVATLDRRYGAPAWASVGPARSIVAKLPSPDELASLGVDGRLLDDTVGRVMMGGLVTQLATFDAAGRGSWAAWVAGERSRWGSVGASEIGRLPGRVELAALDPGPGVGWSRVALGVRECDLGAACVDLSGGNLLVAGPMRSGRTTVLATIAASLRPMGDAPGGPVRRVLIAPHARSLPFDDAHGRDRWWERWWDELVDPFDDAVGSVDAVAAMARRVGEDAGAGRRTVVFVDDVTELEPRVDEVLAGLVGLSRRSEVRVVAAAEASSARSAYGGVVAELRRERRALLLQPDPDLDGDLAGVRLRRRPGGVVPPGRGELVERGAVHLVQVAVPGVGDVPHVGGRSLDRTVDLEVDIGSAPR